jgi:hypothetical protein
MLLLLKRLPTGKYPHLYDELMALDKNNDGGWVGGCHAAL